MDHGSDDGDPSQVEIDMHERVREEENNHTQQHRHALQEQRVVGDLVLLFQLLDINFSCRDLDLDILQVVAFLQLSGRSFTCFDFQFLEKRGKK